VPRNSQSHSPGSPGSMTARRDRIPRHAIAGRIQPDLRPLREPLPDHREHQPVFGEAGVVGKAVEVDVVIGRVGKRPRYTQDGPQLSKSAASARRLSGGRAASTAYTSRNAAVRHPNRGCCRCRDVHHQRFLVGLPMVAVGEVATYMHELRNLLANRGPGAAAAS